MTNTLLRAGRDHYFGLPPWSAARVRTGSLVEQLVVVPGLLLYIGWLGYLRGGTVFELFR